MPKLKQRMIKLEGLTDAVFAIVMTLLVLGLSIPVFKGTSMHQDFTQLLAMWPRFVSYIVTFLMLGYIWSVHHRVYNLMKRSDSLSMWLNIICMMFAALLPFSTSLVAENMGRQLPILVYEGNFFMLMIIGYVNYLYVTGKYRLVDTDIDLHEVRRRKRGWLIGIVFIAIAMSISNLNTIVSMSVFTGYVISAIIYDTFRYRIRAKEQAQVSV